MAHMVQCAKLGREAEGLDEAPFDSPLGQRIYENVSKQAWADWQNHMKMLLNEYRLQPWKKEHQDFIVQQMEQYFFGSAADRLRKASSRRKLVAISAARKCEARASRPRFPLRLLFGSAKINSPLRRARAVNRRDVAQPGRALAWGARGRQFKSAHPDQFCSLFSYTYKHNNLAVWNLWLCTSSRSQMPNFRSARLLPTISVARKKVACIRRP